MSTTELPDLSRDKPVFVDASGRRRRTVRRIAVVSSVALAGMVGIVVAAVLGAPVVPSALLPLPHSADAPPVTANQPAALPLQPITVRPIAVPPRYRDTQSVVVAPAPIASGITTTESAPPITSSQRGNPGHGHGKPTSVTTPPHPVH